MTIIVTDFEQGSPDWHAARLGIPTASGFDRIITPATGKPSAQAAGYRLRLLAEWLTGQAAGPEQTDWMARGIEMEAEARNWYSMQSDADVQQVGIVYRDDTRLVACSPDGLVGEDGGLEVKCPAPQTHVGYLLGSGMPRDYIPQVQGSMWVTGRAWWDFVSYHPDMPAVMVRVERDEAYIKTLDKLVGAFVSGLLDGREELERRGIKRRSA